MEKNHFSRRGVYMGTKAGLALCVCVSLGPYLMYYFFHTLHQRHACLLFLNNDHHESHYIFDIRVLLVTLFRKSTYRP